MKRETEIEVVKSIHNMRRLVARGKRILRRSDKVGEDTRNLLKKLRADRKK